MNAPQPGRLRPFFERFHAATLLNLTQCLFLVCLFVPAASANPDPAQNEPIASIPFDGSSELVVVPVSIDGSRSLRCILDTGMPEGVFLVNPDLGHELGLEYVAKVPVKGTGEDSPLANVAMGSVLSIGGVEVADQRVIVLEETSEVAHLGIDGVVGGSFFLRYTIRIDHATATVDLYDSLAYRTPPDAEALPMTVAGSRPYIDVEVAINGDEAQAVSLFIDSGSNSGVILNTSVIDGLEAPASGLATLIVSGVGGDVHGLVARISQLKIGSTTRSNVLCRFPEQSSGMEQGLLGLGLLREYRVTFNFPDQRLILEPGAGDHQPLEFNMAGLVLRPVPHGRYRVEAVIADSPGAERDVRTGDLLLAIDGDDVAGLGPAETRRRLIRDGKPTILTIEREDRRLDVSIVLRRLI